MSGGVEAIVRRAEELFGDLSLGTVREWKKAHPGRPAVGHLPVYTPRELIHAVGGLPVGLQGGGEAVDIIKGDACFQSYICHIPRSTVELGLNGSYDCLEGIVAPGTCDVIRNLSGLWRLMFPEKLAFYLDLPQRFDPAGKDYYKLELTRLARELTHFGGKPLTAEALRDSLSLYDRNRQVRETLYDLRANEPWLVPTSELYLVVRAGNVLPVEEHTALMASYLEACRSRQLRREDRIRVVAVGAFCEQPPLGLLRTLERAGCYVVEDDLMLGMRTVEGATPSGGDPLDVLVNAYAERAQWSSSRYDGGVPRGAQLAELCKRRKADGVVFMAASFCDPALLDQPPLQLALEKEEIPFTSFKYAENTGQFQGIREQAGTFADSIRLWGAA